MELINATKMQAGYTMGMAPDGRESLVVVVKGTFRFPEKGSKEPVLAEEQVPLVMADTFAGEPGLSAPIYESDFAPRKPKCDVLLNGSCYPPGGKPASKVMVSLRVGSFAKSFNVVGTRTWKKRWFFVTSTKSVPFTRMPITYDKAFGGEDRSHKDPARHKTFTSNPVGLGFHDQLTAEYLNGTTLPNTEEVGNPVKHPKKHYRSMAFGPIGRNWRPRPSFAGTYDEAWLENGFPFLPADFQEAYYQAAPTDQQIEYLRGNEEVELINLTPAGKTRFRLPVTPMPVVFFPRDGEKKETEAVIDTFIIEPDRERFMLVWRSSLPLRKNIFDVVQVVAGVMPKGWYRARELGKTYYRSLGELVAAKMQERAEEE